MVLTWFSGLEKAIVNRVVRPSETIVERLKEWGRNYCLIDGIVRADGAMSLELEEKSGKVRHISANKYTREVRENAIAQLLDEFSAVGRTNSSGSKKKAAQSQAAAE